MYFQKYAGKNVTNMQLILKPFSSLFIVSSQMVSSVSKVYNQYADDTSLRMSILNR